MARRGTDKTVFLVQFPAAYIRDVQTEVQPDKVRTVIELSNPTRVAAFLGKTDADFQFAGRQGAGVAGNRKIKDYLVTRTSLSSGNWQAKFALRLNYAAPLSWFTLGNPSRLVIEAQRLFEEQTTDFEGGLALTKIRKGTGHGPVQMWAARFDPRDGWRVRVEPGGHSVLQREKPSRIAARKRAVLAVNGGFFAYDGARRRHGFGRRQMAPSALERAHDGRLRQKRQSHHRLDENRRGARLSATEPACRFVTSTAGPTAGASRRLRAISARIISSVRAKWRSSSKTAK